MKIKVKKICCIFLAMMMVLAFAPKTLLPVFGDNAGFLSELAFGTGSKADAKGTFKLSPEFDSEVHDYTLYVGDNVTAVYAWATLSDAGTGKTIKAVYTKTNNTNGNVTLTSAKATGAALAQVVAAGVKGNTVAITVGDQTYNITVVRTATLKSLSLTDNDQTIGLSPKFAVATTEYSILLGSKVSSLGIQAEAKTAGATIKVNSQAMGETVTLNWDGDEAKIEIEVANEAENSKNTYTVKVYVCNFDGNGTKEDPFLLKNITDLEKFRDYVNMGFGFYGQYFKLTSNVTLPTGWMPIGDLKTTAKANYIDYQNTYVSDSTPFMGTFDGDGHTITVPSGELTAFGSVSGATLKNFNVYGEKIPGYGVVQYWLRGQSGGMSTDGQIVTIENVKLLSGTHTMLSGFIGGYAGGSDRITIRNCVVEEGVVIGNDGRGFWAGYERTEALPLKTTYPYGPGDPKAFNAPLTDYVPMYQNDFIGSFIGAGSGEIIGCSSSATVLGNNYVGGIIGFKGQSMGDCLIRECSFDGEVKGKLYVGGIVGCGYLSQSAPNTPSVTIQNTVCYGKVTAADYAGGIFGGEITLGQNWNNGVGYIQNNFFGGQLVSTGSHVAAIIGYFNVLDSTNIISNNFYLDGCGSNKGMNLNAVDTSDKYAPDYAIAAGDDPENFNKKVAKEADALDALNAGVNSSTTWKIEGGKLALGNKKHIVSLTSAELNTMSPKTITAFDGFDNVDITVTYNDGNKETIKVLDCEKVDWNFLEVGYRAVQLLYKNAQLVFVLQNTEVITDPAVVAVDDAIALLGEVITLENEDAVAAVRTEYDKLNASQKAQLKNEQTLLDAEQTLADLKVAALKAAAKEVDDLIDAIGTVEYTAESKGLIEAARNAYDELSADEKAYVENLDTLSNAESEYALLERAVLEAERIAREAAAKQARQDAMVKAIVEVFEKLGGAAYQILEALFASLMNFLGDLISF